MAKKRRTLVDEYYEEKFPFGGEQKSRGEIIKYLKTLTSDQRAIDLYLFGLDRAKAQREQAEREFAAQEGFMSESELMDYLRANERTIVAAAQAGDGGAQRIIDAYRIWAKAPRDPGAYGMLYAATDDYRKQKKAEPTL